MHSSGPSKVCGLPRVIDFLELFIKGNVFTFHLSIRYQHRLRGPQGVSDGKPAKQVTNPRKPARNAQALFYSMHECAHKCIARKFTPFSRGKSLFPAFFPSENGERGRNLLRGREALPAQPETGFQHVQESGFVDGRQSRYGKSPDDSPHDSPAIRLVT